MAEHMMEQLSVPNAGATLLERARRVVANGQALHEWNNLEEEGESPYESAEHFLLCKIIEEEKRQAEFVNKYNDGVYKAPPPHVIFDIPVGFRNPRAGNVQARTLPPPPPEPPAIPAPPGEPSADNAGNADNIVLPPISAQSSGLAQAPEELERLRQEAIRHEQLGILAEMSRAWLYIGEHATQLAEAGVFEDEAIMAFTLTARALIENLASFHSEVQSL
jgi:hypothetical protein